MQKQLLKTKRLMQNRVPWCCSELCRASYRYCVKLTLSLATSLCLRPAWNESTLSFHRQYCLKWQYSDGNITWHVSRDATFGLGHFSPEDDSTLRTFQIRPIEQHAACRGQGEGISDGTSEGDLFAGALIHHRIFLMKNACPDAPAKHFLSRNDPIPWGSINKPCIK